MKDSTENLQNVSELDLKETARKAALQAAASVVPETTSLVSYTSRNLLLIIGDDERAMTAVNRLSNSMSIVVLSRATGGYSLTLPEKFAVSYGQLSRFKGHLGEFIAEVTINDKPVNLVQVYHPERKGFDLVLDLSAQPQRQCDMLPFGYYAPTTDEELEEVLNTIPDMVGEFDKPKFFNYNPDICAHGNSGLQACQRCIDACPAEAITSLAERINVDPYLCQGGGICSTVCPSGAISYAYPRLQDTLEKLRCMLKAYQEAGGTQACVLFYGEEDHETLSAMLPKFGGHVIPFQVEEAGSVGMEVWLSALGYGAEQVILLTSNNTSGQIVTALDTQLGYTQAMLAGMGFDADCIKRQDLESIALAEPAQLNSDCIEQGNFMALNDKRSGLRMAVDHLYPYAPTPQDVVALPAGAPFGEIKVNKNSCTLCMACVSVCPASALSDGGDLPQLNFSEANCVQCGLCSNACPEMAITLSARFNFDPDLKRKKRVLNEDEPFCCVGCGKPFATKKVIDTISDKLKSHHMFQDQEALNRLRMCEDCRVRDMFQQEREAGG